MREFSAPPTYTVPATGNLTDDIVANSQRFGGKVVASRRQDGEWRDVTARQFLGEVQAAAKGLLASGVAAGDRVALISKTRYEWTLLDYAIWYAGAITVPVYETSSQEQIAWILTDSAAVLAVAETPDHVAKVDASRDELTELRDVVCLDDGGLDRLMAGGLHISAAELETRRAAVTAESVATLIYTSGTTGRPKGCT
ncbi:MAG: AMP-binding protein, partial [Actinomycetota bacterium]|nr:AMP-binding protein [Actinomycetota bacterium]